MNKIRRHFEEKYPTVPFWVIVVTFTVGISLALFITYIFYEWLNNYINLTNPSPLERLQLLLLGLSFSCLAYYFFKRGGLFKSNDNHDKTKGDKD